MSSGRAISTLAENRPSALRVRTWPRSWVRSRIVWTAVSSTSARLPPISRAVRIAITTSFMS